MADQVTVFSRSIPRDEFLNQIRYGVFDAMHQLMTSGSGSPSGGLIKCTLAGYNRT